MPFCDTILFFSGLTLKYLILLRCYDAMIAQLALIVEKVGLYVEIQMAQKLVVIEKMVKMRELLKQSLRYIIKMF